MCGVIAAIGELKANEEAAFKQLLICDSLRGTDSTGIFTITSLNYLHIAKQVGNPFELFETRSFDNAMKGLMRVMVGHNRYATQGAVNRKNAHPFDFDNVIGVHNGTLRNKYQLLDAKDFTVDSENLYHHIDQKGINAAVSNLDGAYALVWWDKVEGTLKVLRNKERPLYCVETLSGNYFMASEAWMLEGVLSRNNVLTKTEPKLFDEDYLYSFDLDVKTGSIDKIVKRHTPSGWKGYKPPAYTPPAVVPPPAVAPPSNTLSVVKKKQLFEVIAGGKDRHGGTYFECYSESFPADDIRLYYNDPAINSVSFIGEFFEAELMAPAVFTVDGKFYKVFSSSVDWLKGEDEVQLLSCGWCTASFGSNEGHGKCSDGSFLCPGCVQDPEIKDYIQYQLVGA